MAGVRFDDIENAFHFVSASPYGTSAAYLNVETGEIFYQSEMTGIDELDGKKMNWDQMIGLPHKNDLELGHSLVFEFVEVNLPDAYRQVRDMFRKKGAYSRFKGFLESRDGLRMSECSRPSGPGVRRMGSPYRTSCSGTRIQR